MAQINIKLTDEQKEEISRIAKEKGVSITQLVINSILNKEQFYTDNVPYGSSLYFKSGDTVKKGDLICKWDPFNAVIVSEYAGILRLHDVIEGVT